MMNYIESTSFSAAKRSGLNRLSILLLLALTLHGLLSGLEAGGVSESDVAALIEALRNSPFLTGATIVAYAKNELVPETTILIPTDQAISNIFLSGIPENKLLVLLKSHMLYGNFSFDQLQLFPVNTFLPTISNYSVEVTSNSNGNFSFNNAQIVAPNLFARTQSVITCHGISAVLNVAGLAGGQPPAPPPGPSSSPTPGPAPSSTLTRSLSGIDAPHSHNFADERDSVPAPAPNRVSSMKISNFPAILAASCLVLTPLLLKF